MSNTVINRFKSEFNRGMEYYEKLVKLTKAIQLQLQPDGDRPEWVQIVQNVLHHDVYHSYSDDANVHRAGAARGKDLREQLINAAEVYPPLNELVDKVYDTEYVYLWTAKHWPALALERIQRLKPNQRSLVHYLAQNSEDIVRITADGFVGQCCDLIIKIQELTGKMKTAGFDWQDHVAHSRQFNHKRYVERRVEVRKANEGSLPHWWPRGVGVDASLQAYIDDFLNNNLSQMQSLHTSVFKEVFVYGDRMPLTFIIRDGFTILRVEGSYNETASILIDVD